VTVDTSVEVRYAGVVVGRGLVLRDEGAEGTFVAIPEPLPVGTLVTVRIGESVREARVDQVVESAEPATVGMRLRWGGAARAAPAPAPQAAAPAPAVVQPAPAAQAAPAVVQAAPAVVQPAPAAQAAPAPAPAAESAPVAALPEAGDESGAIPAPMSLASSADSSQIGGGGKRRKKRR
jgi:hypothetical protein